MLAKAPPGEKRAPESREGRSRLVFRQSSPPQGDESACALQEWKFGGEQLAHRHTLYTAPWGRRKLMNASN